MTDLIVYLIAGAALLCMGIVALGFVLLPVYVWRRVGDAQEVAERTRLLRETAPGQDSASITD